MAHLVDRENTVVFGTVAAILLSVVWSQRVRKTEQEYITRIKFLESSLQTTKHTSTDYDSRLTNVQLALQKASLAKAVVDEKLSNALKVSERAYQSLVLADQRQTELEEEIRRLKALRDTSASSAAILDSVQKMSDQERGKFEGLLSQVQLLEGELTTAREQLKSTEQLKRELSQQILDHKAEYRATAEKVSEKDAHVQALQDKLREAELKARESDKNRSSFEELLEKTKAELANAVSKLESLEALVSEIQQKNIELERSLGTAHSNQSLASQQAEAAATALSKEIADLKEQLSFSSGILSNTKNAHAACDHNIALTTERADTAEKELAALQRKIEGLEVDFKTAVDETFGLKAERGTLEGKWRQSEEHLEVARRDAKALQDNLAVEKATLVALEQLKVELQGKVDLTTSERDSLRARLLAAEEAKRIAEDKLAATLKECELHTAHASELQAALDKSAQDLEAAYQESQKASNEAETLKNKLSDAEAKVQALESEKSSLTMDEKALGDKVGSLEAALIVLREEKAGLEKEVGSEREAKFAAETEASALQAHLIGLQSNLAGLEASKSEVESQLAAAVSAKEGVDELLTAEKKSVATLQAQLESANTQIHASAAKAEEADKTNAMLATELDEVKKQLSAKSTEVDELKAAAVAAAAAVVALETDRHELKEKGAQLSLNIEELQKGLANVHQEKTSLLEEAKAAEGRLKAADERIKASEEKAGSLDADLTSTKTALEMMTRSQADLQTQVNALLGEKASLTTRLEESGATDRALLDKLAAAESQLESQRSLIEQLETAKTGLTAEVETVKGEFGAARTELEGVKGELITSRSQVASLESDKSSLSTQVSDLSGKLSRLEQDHAALEAEKSIIAGHVDETTAKLAEANGKVSTLETELGVAVAASAVIEEQKAALSKRVDVTEKALHDATEELVALKVDLAASRAAEAEARAKNDDLLSKISALTARVAELEGMLAASEAEKHSLSETLLKKDEVIQAAEEKNMALTAEIDILRQQLADLRNASEAQDAKITQLATLNDDLEETKANLQAELALVKKSAFATETKLTVMEEQRKVALARADAAEKDHAAAKEEVERLSASLALAESVKNTLHSEKEQLTTQLAEMKGAAEGLNAKILELEQDLVASRDAFAKEKEEKTRLSRINDDLGGQLADLQKKLSGAESSVTDLKKVNGELSTNLQTASATAGANAAEAASNAERLLAAEANIASYVTRIKELEDAQAQMAELETKFAAISSDKASLEGQLSDKTKAEQIASGKVVDLEKELSELRNGHASTSSDLSKAREEAAALQKRVEDMDQAHSALQTSATDVSEQLKTSSSKVSELERAASSAEEARLALRAELDAAQAKLQAAEELSITGEQKTKSLQAELDVAIAEKGTLQTEKADLAHAVELSEGKAAAASARATDFENTLSETRTHLTDSQAEKDKLAAQVQQMSDEQAAHIKAKEEADAKAAAGAKERDDLLKRIDELQAAHAEFSNRASDDANRIKGLEEASTKNTGDAESSARRIAELEANAAALQDKLHGLEDKLSADEREAVAKAERIKLLEDENEALRAQLRSVETKMEDTKDAIGAFREQVAIIASTTVETVIPLNSPGPDSVGPGSLEPPAPPKKKRVSAFAAEGGDQLWELDQQLAETAEKLHIDEDFEYPIIHVTSNERHSPKSSPTSTLSSRPRVKSGFFSFSKDAPDSPPTQQRSPKPRERVDSGGSDTLRRRFSSLLGSKHSDDSLKEKAKDKDGKRRLSFIASALPVPRADSGGLLPAISSTAPTLTRKSSKLHKHQASDAS